MVGQCSLCGGPKYTTYGHGWSWCTICCVLSWIPNSGMGVYAVTNCMNACGGAVASIVSASSPVMVQMQCSDVFNVASIQGRHVITTLCDLSVPLGYWTGAVVPCLSCRSTVLLVPYHRIMMWPRCRTGSAKLICREMNVIIVRLEGN
jgi:hypothetical protein